MAFLDLGERLRQRGQYAAAATVALAGLAHYPATADAHDLLARIRADQGDDGAASSAWQAALECGAVCLSNCGFSCPRVPAGTWNSSRKANW